MSAVAQVVTSVYELGAALGIEGAMLEAYAAQDKHGGVDGGWFCGSLWAAEGRALYALTRALNVRQAVEFGTWHGCSATHIAQALHDNPPGEYRALDCVDIWEGAGVDIPAKLSRYIWHQHTDMCAYAQKAADDGIKFSLIFEDGPHDADTVRTVWSLAKTLLMPGGVIVSHDALHASAGPHIRAGIEAAGFTPVYALVGGSDCGLAVWRAE